MLVVVFCHFDCPQAEHQLSYLNEKLEDANVDLDDLRRMSVAEVRRLPLEYGDASTLCVALGKQNVYQ